MQTKPEGNLSGFLVIQVKVGDTVTIGNHIILHISERKGNLLRIAVKAPKDHKVVRAHAKE